MKGYGNIWQDRRLTPTYLEHTPNKFFIYSIHLVFIPCIYLLEMNKKKKLTEKKTHHST